MANRFSAGMICMLSVLLMLAVSAAAFAEDISLSALSDEEVVSLYARVNEELVTRNIRKTAAVPKGTYIAGKDLPCGSYIYTCLAEGDDWGNLTIYSDEGAGKLLQWEVLSAPKENEEPETIFIKLNEGDQLKSDVPFSLTISTGIFFQ